MSYHTLHTLKYIHHLNNRQLKQLYQKKLHSHSTVVTNLHYFIDGYSLPLFYIKLPKLTILQQTVYQNSIDIMQKVNHLSDSQQQEFFITNLRKEIQMTNKIEGLHTTAQEISTAIDGALAHKATNQFQPFAKMYLLINQRRHLKITKLSDIRKIYNHLFKLIFPKNVFPQHTLFRNNFIRIGSSYTTAYLPKAHEKEFIPDLQAWLKFINSHQVSPLIKACIAHFFFESIHPFNDGNGRTGRYILCTYLASKIDRYTAINFSQMINRHEKTYYNAFKYLNDPLVFGDVTLFIISMFKIIINSQHYLLTDLTE